MGLGGYIGQIPVAPESKPYWPRLPAEISLVLTTRNTWYLKDCGGKRNTTDMPDGPSSFTIPNPSIELLGAVRRNTEMCIKMCIKSSRQAGRIRNIEILFGKNILATNTGCTKTCDTLASQELSTPSRLLRLSKENGRGWRNKSISRLIRLTLRELDTSPVVSCCAFLLQYAVSTSMTARSMTTTMMMKALAGPAKHISDRHGA